MAARRPPRHRLAMLAGAAVAGVAAFSVVAGPGTGDPGLPDLVSHAPDDPRTHVYRDGRLLLRFDGFVSNAAGAGELRVEASDPDARGRMRDAAQYRGGERLDVRDGFRVVFEREDGHDHYHLKDAAEYTLWTEDRSAQVALAQKTEAGFCLEDTRRFAGDAPRKYIAASSGPPGAELSAFCRNEDPLIMGVSPGWRDVYGAYLAFQWIDVSDVAPGRYRLASRMDPGNVIAETNEGNSHAFEAAVVPGYRPKAVSAGRVGAGARTEVSLAADRFESECYDDPAGSGSEDEPYCDPGPARYVIETLPEKGTLRQGSDVLGVGSALSSPRVTYTADAGAGGADGFTYSVHDATRPGFPRPESRPAASVTVEVGAPNGASVAISNAPPTLTAGLAVQLEATVVNGPSGVSWSASAGTISPSGLYVAPAAPPPGGTVTITARSEGDPSVSAEVVIAIVAAPSEGAPPAAIADAACATAPPRATSSSSGRVGLTAQQLLINQRISQAAIRRADAVERWLDEGVATRDLCGNGIGSEPLAPSVVIAGSDTHGPVEEPSPRKLVLRAGPSGDAGGVELSRRQLLINQRIAQAAVRRMNGLAARVQGGLTGGDLRAGAVTAGKLGHDLRIVDADMSVPRPAASVTALAAPARGDASRIGLSPRQLLINQRISQAAVRRANDLQDTLRRGLTGENFRDDTIVGLNLAPGLRP